MVIDDKKSKILFLPSSSSFELLSSKPYLFFILSKAWWLISTKGLSNLKVKKLVRLEDGKIGYSK